MSLGSKIKQADNTENIQSEEFKIVEDITEETSEVIEESEDQDDQEAEDEVVVSIEGESPPQ